VKLSLTDYPQA